MFALSNKANPEQIGRLPMQTITAAPFFLRTMVMHVHAGGVALLDSSESPTCTLSFRRSDPWARWLGVQVIQIALSKGLHMVLMQQMASRPKRYTPPAKTTGS